MTFSAVRYIGLGVSFIGGFIRFVGLGISIVSLGGITGNIRLVGFVGFVGLVLVGFGLIGCIGFIVGIIGLIMLVKLVGFVGLFDCIGEPAFDLNFNNRSVVGKLNFLAQTARPDIMYATHQIAKYSSDPRTSHGEAVLYLIRYLKKTHDLGLLFKLPRIPAEAIRDLQDELSEFELPARQLDAEVMDEFHSQASEIRHRGKDHRSSISSNPPVIPQNFSGSSIAASSENSEDNLFQSFIQSPGSARSSNSSPEQLFQDHFQAREEPRDETTQEALTDDGEITGSAANLIPEPEPTKTPEPRRPKKLRAP